MRAVLFDMDGVVVDNMGDHARAWTEFLARHGVTLDPAEFFTRTAGMPTRAVLSYFLKKELEPQEAARLAQEKESLYQQMYRPALAPLPGLAQFLASCRSAGFRLGLGTGSDVRNVSFVLDGLGLRSAFDAIVGVEDVSRGKPAPETFLTLAARLGVRPRDCAVFEDALLGETAARAAGMKVVAVTTSHPAAEFAGPDLVIRDFSTLTADGVLGLWA